MGWILRRPEDRTNPTLAGGVYGRYVTAGLGVYWTFKSSRVYFVLFISDGGKYGMDSASIRVSYKGGDITPTDWKFHPGKFTKQISPVTVGAIDTTANTFTAVGAGFSNNDPVRFHVRGGNFPGGLTDAKFWVYNKVSDTYSISSTDPAVTTTPVDLTTSGTGTLKVWLANAGWDDPDQGLPAFVPETKTTFSGICYVEGKLPSAYNTDTEPTWEDFRIEGIGRKLMNYDSSGAELGVVDSTSNLLSNPALIFADLVTTEMKRPTSRIDFSSWANLKAAAPVLVWQRSDTEVAGRGFRAEYGVHSGSPTYADPIFIQRDSQINYPNTTASPGYDVPATNFWVRWTGKIKFKYGETYTFKATIDDYIKIVINGTTVLEQTGVGTFTGTFTATANQVATADIKFYNSAGPYECVLKWSSTSLAEEIIPVQSMYEPDYQIERMSINIASASPVETANVFDQVMGRCPGWDFTDVDGKIKFLGPDRSTAYEFKYDAEDDDAVATFINGTFEKTRRHRRERKNWALYSYRDKQYTGYPENFVEQDRPRLRALGNGMPDNDAPKELMVMDRDQARRVAEADFALSTDPTHNIALSSQKASAVATYSQFVRVKNWVVGDNRVEDSTCLVQNYERRGNTIVFTLLPIVLPLSAEEVV